MLLKKLDFINLLSLFFIFPPRNTKNREIAYNFHTLALLFLKPLENPRIRISSYKLHILLLFQI